VRGERVSLRCKESCWGLGKVDGIMGKKGEVVRDELQCPALAVASSALLIKNGEGSKKKGGQIFVHGRIRGAGGLKKATRT